MSNSGSRSSVWASRSSINSRRVAPADSNRLNSSSPRCSCRSVVISAFSEGPLRQRWRAMRTSMSISSSCDEFRTSASAAATAPSCTQIHNGQRSRLSLLINGCSTSSSACRTLLLEIVFSSSRQSDETLAPCRHSASTPGTQRLCKAESKGVSLPMSALTCALASTRTSTALCIVSAATWRFVTSSCRAEREKLPSWKSGFSPASSSSSCALGSAPSSRLLRMMSKLTSRWSSNASRNSCSSRRVAASV
mmetsp:Transcript_12694/g.30228  ORF Transcript_12694/g.30228 Transcript_12694/m.30228 type:complete len:250 (+) Transcript_12694:239-988(+)